MRVAVVTHYFPTSSDPWAGHSAYQTLRLLAQRCAVRVFYPEVRYPGLVRPKSSHAIDRGWAPAGVEVSYIPYPALPVVSRPLNGFAIARTLRPAVRAWRPDAILNYVIYPDGYAAVRIGRALGVPVVVTAIGSDLNRISDRVCKALTQATLRHADTVATVSHDLARTAQRLGSDPGRTRAELNGIDTGIFHPRDKGECRRELGLGAEGEVVVYVGRLDLRKGLVELVEAIAELARERPGLQCYVIGDGAAKGALVEAIARHNAGGCVTLVASQDTDKVAVWMGAADLVTLPSYNEGCPNVVIEALGAGRPVVATRVGGIPELMDETCGRLIAPRDVAALVGGLREVLEQTWSAEAISAQHSRSWGDVAKEFYELLEGAIREHAAQRS